MQNPTLEELASADWIARAGDTTALRATLAALTPKTIVTDGAFAGSMAQLAGDHQTSEPTSRPAMTEHQAWGWACADLVFNGFCVVDDPAAPAARLR